MLLELLILFTIGTVNRGVDLGYDLEGNLYVLEASSDRLLKYSSTGDSLGVVGGFGRGEREFDGPHGLFAGRGTGVWVADRNNHRVQRFDRNLEFESSIFTRDLEDEVLRFGYPLDVAISRQGEIHILDGENLTRSGRFVRSIGDDRSGSGALVDPRRLELDNRDNVYVLDRGRIRQFDPFGTWLRDISVGKNGGVATFSIRNDTITLVGTNAVLKLYALDQTGFPAPLPRSEGSVGEGIRAVLRIGPLFYILGERGLTVRELPNFAVDSMLDRSHETIPASQSEE